MRCLGHIRSPGAFDSYLHVTNIVVLLDYMKSQNSITISQYGQPLIKMSKLALYRTVLSIY